MLGWCGMLAWDKSKKGFYLLAMLIQMHSLPLLYPQKEKGKRKKKKKRKEKKGICAKKKARLGFLPLLE